MSNSLTPKPLESLEESRLTEWLTNNGKNIIYGLVAFIVILVAFYRFSTGHSVRTEQNYVQAANDFAAYTKQNGLQDAAVANETLQRLNAIIASHPELHAVYDGAMAQALLNQGRVAEAKPLIVRTLARTKSDDLPVYADYAETTLMISEEHYGEALKRAQTLQQQMIDAINNQEDDAARSFGDEIFALNLLRIAMLQQQLGDKQAELQTWHQWKQYAALEKAVNLPAKVDAQAFRNVIQQLAIGSLSLPDYITYREKVLKS